VHLRKPHGADVRLHIRNLVRKAQRKEVIHLNPVQLQALAAVKLLGCLLQAATHPDVHHFVGKTDRRVHPGEKGPFAGAVTGLFGQFADRGVDGLLIGIPLACRKLGEDRTRCVAVLTLDQYPALRIQRNDRCRARMADVLAGVQRTVDLGYTIAQHAEKMACEEYLAVHARLMQRGFAGWIDTQTQGLQRATIDSCTASTHRVSSGPGRIPSTSTAAPLAPSTTRPSSAGSGVERSTGPSKYMVFTTRR